jgi:hypothetical protein
MRPLLQPERGSQSPCGVLEWAVLAALEILDVTGAYAGTLSQGFLGQPGRQPVLLELLGEWNGRLWGHAHTPGHTDVGAMIP